MEPSGYAESVNGDRPVDGGAAGGPSDMASRSTHLDEHGRAHMVDVSHKQATVRLARAESVLRVTPQVRERLWRGDLPKGEALAVARIAGIQAAKETSRLVPLCHPLPLSSVSVDFVREGEDSVRITAEARTVAPTGVEMEALTAACVAALTLYDMAKSQCKGATIERVRLLLKSGGKSGLWEREE
ncbi:MAG: cyclic pyranopterin monophosphate synthase MoaC [Planctomycetota bacterium]